MSTRSQILRYFVVCSDGKDGTDGIPVSWVRIARVVIAAIAMFAAGGCGSIGVALGTRTRLDKLPIVSISATLHPQPGLSPGRSGQLIIVATAEHGHTLTTVGAGRGTVLFDSFTFDPTIVRVSGSGVVSLPSDPRVSNGQTAHVRIAVVGHPEVVTDLAVPARYDVAFAAHFSGSPGINGSSGTDGLAGSDGSPGSTDPSNASAGGSGTDGARGGDGGDGGDGTPGENVHAWVTVKQDAQPLIQVRVAGQSHEDFFLIDPNGGSLWIYADGGRGGHGGTGGRGGHGGSGGFGSPNGVSGQDGFNGSDGRPGLDGAAGNILVSVDPAARQYLDRFHFLNRDGLGLAGPAPQVRIEPVPPLW
ncbi:MAG: hypothetical protein ACJ8R9_09145 [Steroidobacteraceae bacterium]